MAAETETEVEIETRVLAMVTKVLEKKPILNADKIEIVRVLGWDVIVKKDEINVGDFCVYICIDTKIDPTRSYFSFLANDKNPTAHVRINTIKMRGVYSQGLILPISVLPDGFVFEEGTNVTNELGIMKYEKNDPTCGPMISGPRGNFPTYIVDKTDENNVRTCNSLLHELYGKKAYFSLKMDGSSITIAYNKNGALSTSEMESEDSDPDVDAEGNKINPTLIVCSRNNRLKSRDQSMWHLVEKLGLETKLETYGRNLCIQGEFCGPKVNCNKMEINEHKLYVFNIRDIDTRKYLGMDDIIKVCKDLGLIHVPILEVLDFDESWTIEKIQNYANDVTYDACADSNNKKLIAEGIVIRPVEPLWSDKIHKNLSFKMINQNYKD
jgi:RNA ligase (TIGR02306 family)